MNYHIACYNETRIGHPHHYISNKINSNGHIQQTYLISLNFSINNGIQILFD